MVDRFVRAPVLYRDVLGRVQTRSAKQGVMIPCCVTFSTVPSRIAAFVRTTCTLGSGFVWAESAVRLPLPCSAAFQVPAHQCGPGGESPSLKTVHASGQTVNDLGNCFGIRPAMNNHVPMHYETCAARATPSRSPRQAKWRSASLKPGRPSPARSARAAIIASYGVIPPSH